VDVGSVLSGYRLEAHLGQGAFATVFRASHEQTGAPAAVKVLHSSLMDTSVAVLRFLREAEMLVALNHPAIVRIFSVGETPAGIPYLIMEWIDGHTLSDEARRRGRFSLDELLGVLEPLCGALAAAHDAGFVHRDLKASNVMLMPEGDWFRIKLVDFGIAKLLDGDSHGSKLTTTGTAIGTPPYMAPEQFTGSKIDARTDVYALGVLCFRLLAGRLPFESKSNVELAHMHIAAEPPRLGAFVPALAAMDPVLRRCLAKRREARYSSALEVLADVRRVAGVPSAQARPAPPPWIGVHVSVFSPLEEAEWGDDLVDAIFDALDEAAQSLTSEGMTVEQSTGNAILAVMESHGDMAAVLGALHAACALEARLVSILEQAGASAVIAVHGSDAEEELARAPWRLYEIGHTVVATKRIQTYAQGAGLVLRPVGEGLFAVSRSAEHGGDEESTTLVRRGAG
jgi:eukaryotic-like serine/threonine-protein kinase